MPDYRRYRVLGETYFFTVNLLQRYPNDLLVRHIEALRSAVRHVRDHWQFHIGAWVVLPDHLHCVWTLPPADNNFTNRWRLIKPRSTGLATDRNAILMQKKGLDGIHRIMRRNTRSA